MGSIKFHEIWIEQCKAAIGIKLRFGLTDAFDYIRLPSTFSRRSSMIQMIIIQTIDFVDELRFVGDESTFDYFRVTRTYLET